MKFPFIKVGFEFTAALTPKGYDSRYFSGLVNCFKDEDLPNVPKWINDNYEAEEYGCEIPSPVITTKNDITKHFNEFKDFAKRFKFTNLNKAMGDTGLGGCHIHLDTTWLDVKTKKKLFINLAHYITNNPQLNWAFNDPNDNVNANSLLCNLCWMTSSPNIRLRDLGAIVGSRKETECYKPFELDNSPYKAFCLNPLNFSLYKCYAIKNSMTYNTIEFRIFDMPDTLERHLLHYDVAMAIYKHCLTLAQQNKKIPAKIKDFKQVYRIPQTKAISMLKESMKELKIPYNRVKHLETNIHTRYKWTTADVNTKNPQITVENCYLL